MHGKHVSVVIARWLVGDKQLVRLIWSWLEGRRDGCGRGVYATYSQANRRPRWCRGQLLRCIVEACLSHNNASSHGGETYSNFCRAMLCISAAITVVRCPSVYHGSWVAPERIKLSSNFCHHCVYSQAILVFHAKRDGEIPTGTPLTWASNAGGV